MALSDFQTDPLAFLRQVYSKEIEENEKHTELWEQYKKKHESAIKGLQQLVSELTVNCMVPIGKKALMKGKLTHTNEILACIGDGYFVKYTAQQAIELCKRRIKRSEEFLKKLEQERNLFEVRQMVPLNSGAFGFGDCKDVVELWDDKKVEDWRVEHRKKEKEYRQKLIESKQLDSKETNEKLAEEDLFRRLDELEIEEELADELNRLEEQEKITNNKENDTGSLEDRCKIQGDCEDEDEYSDEYESDDDDEDEDEDEDEENEDGVEDKENEDKIVQEKQCEKKVTTEEKTDSLEVNCKKEVNKSVPVFVGNKEKCYIKDNKINGKFEVSIVNESCLQLKQDIQQNVKTSPTIVQHNTDDEKIAVNHKKTKSSNKRVSFANPHFVDVMALSETKDLSSGSSKTENKTENLTNGIDSDDVIKIEFRHSKIEFKEEDISDHINSPSDIYRMFCQKPKSILKTSPGPIYVSKSISGIDESLQEEEEEEEEADENASKKSTYTAVVQDIQERKVDFTAQPTVQTDKKKAISRFKLERANKKRT